MVEAWLLRDGTIVLTLLMLEAVLSFDNAAVLAAMVRKLPVQDRKKALLYGLLGAYGLRIGAILLASFLISNPVFKVIGGGYLIFVGVRHFRDLLSKSAKDGTVKDRPIGGMWVKFGLPSLVAVIIQIELMDLAFAIDQVVVAVAFTEKILLIIIASIIGILFLRLAAAAIARVMDWLPTLEHMAFVAVIYVGLKLILLHPVWAPDGDCVVPILPDEHLTGTETAAQIAAAEGCHIPTPISVAITLSLFAVPIFLKLAFGIPRPRPDHSTGAEELAAAVHGAPPPEGSPGAEQRK